MSQDENKSEDKGIGDEFFRTKLTEIEKNLLEKELKAYKRRRFLSLLNSVTLLTTGLVMATVFTSFFIKDENDLGKAYFSRTIKTDIQKAIKSDADIYVVKNIFNNREVKTYGLFTIFSKDDEKKYVEGTPLSSVLDDILTDYYLEGAKDTLYLKRVQGIIESHRQTNPFDKLDPNQKNDFENLRIKLKDDFGIVQNDVTRIADEMYNRNVLLTKYLDKSNISYWISIIGLFTSIVLSFIQLVLSSPSKIIKALKEGLKEQENESKLGKH